MKKTTILVATCALLASVAGLRIAGAQGASTSAGVYTAEQAKRGAALYKEQCLACHGEDLKGNDIIPIPGTRRQKYLLENIAAAHISLTGAKMQQLNQLVPQVVGERYDALGMSVINQ